MNLPEGIGRREVLIGVGILVVIAIIAIPFTGYTQKKNRRAECAQLVEAIRAAQIEHGKAFPGEGYVSAGWAPRDPTDLNGDAVKWKASSGFSDLGWSPTKEGYEWVRGTYRVAATKTSFKVIGRCDIDADGVPSEYEADFENAAKAKTASDIY